MNWFREQKYNICNMVRVLWKREPKHEIAYAWYHLWWDFVYPPWRACKQVKVVISYLPVLWRDRDWDHAYFLSLMQHKLKRMEKVFRNGKHVGCEKDADKMLQCIELIDRINKEDYAAIPYELHSKKWGQGHSTFTPSKDNPGCSTWNITYENCKTPEDEQQRRQEFLELMTLEENLRNRDYKLLFYIIRRNLRKWWG